MVNRGSGFVVGYDGEIGAGDLEAVIGGKGGRAGGSGCEGEMGLGSIDRRFISSCIRFCSAAACPSAELFFVCSIECSS